MPLLRPYPDVPLAFCNRIVWIIHSIARHRLKLGLVQAGRVNVVIAHLELLQRNDHLILAEAEEAAEAYDGVLLTRTVHQNLLNGSDPFVLGTIDRFIDQL